jgi:hypothetical protein
LAPLIFEAENGIREKDARRAGGNAHVRHLDAGRRHQFPKHPDRGTLRNVSALLLFKGVLVAPVLGNDKHARAEIAKPASPRANLI